jgi:hypothetical protein
VVTAPHSSAVRQQARKACFESGADSCVCKAWSQYSPSAGAQPTRCKLVTMPLTRGVLLLTLGRPTWVTRQASRIAVLSKSTIRILPIGDFCSALCCRDFLFSRSCRVTQTNVRLPTHFAQGLHATVLHSVQVAHEAGISVLGADGLRPSARRYVASTAAAGSHKTQGPGAPAGGCCHSALLTES